MKLTGQKQKGMAEVQSSQLHSACCSHHRVQPVVTVSSSRGTERVTSAQAGSVCVCACLYVCLPVEREKWKEWDSKLTKALKCSSSLKDMEFVLLFLRTFCFLIAAFSVASSCRIREVSLSVRTLQLLQLLKHFTQAFCTATSGLFSAPSVELLITRCLYPKLGVLPAWCVLLKVLQHRSGTGKVRVLGDLLQWRSVGIVELKSQR